MERRFGKWRRVKVRGRWGRFFPLGFKGEKKLGHKDKG